MSNSILSQKVKELRNRKGISQEVLADESGLSLRTIQRIENNETVPRGDTLKKIAKALDTSVDEIVDWEVNEDLNYLVLMSVSALSFLVLPLLGIIFPLVMWITKKGKIKKVNKLGKAILNFQISWILFLFLSYALIGVIFLIFALTNVDTSWMMIAWQIWLPLTIMFYLFNIFMIIKNTIKVKNDKPYRFKPSLVILK